MPVFVTRAVATAPRGEVSTASSSGFAPRSSCVTPSTTAAAAANARTSRRCWTRRRGGSPLDRREGAPLEPRRDLVGGHRAGEQRDDGIARLGHR